jgi:hypothetical protein
LEIELKVRSSMSSVSSPPTMTTGRLTRTQRRSRGTADTTLFETSAVSSSDSWFTGSNTVTTWPSTSIAYGTYMSVPSVRPIPSAITVLPLPGGP